MVGSLILGTSDSTLLYYSGISNTQIGSFNIGYSADSLIYNNNLYGIKSLIGSGALMIHSGTLPVVVGSLVYSFGNTSYGGTIINGNLYTLMTGPIASDDIIIKHSGISNIFVGSFSAGADGVSELSFYNDNLYSYSSVGGDNNKIVYNIDILTQSVIGSVVLTEPSDNPGYFGMGGIAFDSNGNLLLLADGDTSAHENWTVYKYDGFSSSCTGSVVFGGDGLLFTSITYVEETQQSQSYSQEIEDALSLNDSLNLAVIATKELTDSISIGETINFLRSSSEDLFFVGDNLTLLDELGFQVIASKQIEDTTTLSETISFLKAPSSKLFSETDALSLAETFSTNIIASLQLEDALSLGETINFVRSVVGTAFEVNESIGLSETTNFTRNIKSFSQSITDNLSLSEVIDFLRYSPEDLFSITDNLTIGETILFERYSPEDLFSLSENFGLSENVSFARNIVSRTLDISDILALGESNLFEIGGITPTSIYTIKSLIKAITLDHSDNDFIIKGIPKLLNLLLPKQKSIIIKNTNSININIKEE